MTDAKPVFNICPHCHHVRPLAAPDCHCLKASAERAAKGPDLSTGWLLLSRGLYWRPNRAGYTGIKAHAGRYPLADAEFFAAKNGALSVVHESRAPEFSPAARLDSQAATFALEQVVRDLAATRLEVDRLRAIIAAQGKPQEAPSAGDARSAGKPRRPN